VSGPDSLDTEDDPWLTVAEVAAEVHLNPATIRLWISKGRLPARRMGRRKLLIRRSDLDRMLEATRRQNPPGGYLPQTDRPAPPGRRTPPPSGRQLSTADIHGSRAAPGEMEQILQGLQLADEAWQDAQLASENAPPDPGFPNRVRDLAEACAQQATWLLKAAQTAGFEWTPIPDRRQMAISHELRPGANRPGPQQLWTEFDRVVQRLGTAMEGGLMYNVAWQYRDLATVTHAIADALLGQTHGESEERR
jgi:excisionase family DNA binding protein